MVAAIKWQRVDIILLGIPLGICGCMLSVVLVHDYAYHLDKSAHWSEFSSYRTASEVKSILDTNLTVGQATTTDALSFLSLNGVEDRNVSGDAIICWTPTHEPVIKPENPLDIRGYNLFTEWSFGISLQFEDGKLASIESQRRIQAHSPF